MKSTIYSRMLITLAVAALLTACSSSSDQNKEARLKELKAKQADLSKEIKKLEEEIAKEKPDSAMAKAKPVSVEELTTTKFNHYVQTQGRVESENNILVSAETMGVVKQVFVTEGQQVSKGQVLAQIDNAVIARSMESMKAQLDLATSVYNRQKNLWDQKIGTEVQYLQAKTNKESLEKQLASLQEQNDMTRVKSPISGTVDEVMAKTGQSLSPGMPAFRVINADDLKLVASVSEAYVTDIKKGDKVVINIPELKKEIEGKVSFVGRNIDPLSRSFSIEVNLPSEAYLRPNMTATVKVIYHTEPSAVVVPVNVIQSLNNEKVVYIAENKGKKLVASRRKVTVDGVFGNEAQVEGLKPGEKLITVGYQGLNDGEPVKI